MRSVEIIGWSGRGDKKERKRTGGEWERREKKWTRREKKETRRAKKKTPMEMIEGDRERD